MKDNNEVFFRNKIYIISVSKVMGKQAFVKAYACFHTPRMNT